MRACYIKRPQLMMPVYGVASASPSYTLLAVSSKRSYWMNGEKLQIYLLKDARFKEKEIGEVYAHWLKDTSLSFEFVGDKFISDIRIDYNERGGSWSYIGTDALLIDKNTVTLNIGWPGKEVIYHEVGHSLGLLHEHQNPTVAIKWDKNAVIKELTGPPNNWTVEMIYDNIFDAINPDSVNYTSFDGKSVMLYFFPDEWTLDGKGTDENPVPSATDLEHIQALYPKPKPTIEIDPRKLAKEFPDLHRLLRTQLVYIANAFGEKDFTDSFKRDLINYIQNL